MQRLAYLQGFDVNMVGCLVHAVPSMHIACEFLSELINQPSLPEQVFGVALTTHLAETYPMQATLVAAVQCTMRIRQSASSYNRDLAICSLPYLARLARVFPSDLTEDIVGVLVALGSSSKQIWHAESQKSVSLDWYVDSVFGEICRSNIVQDVFLTHR